VGKSIARLEERTGLRLFDRTNRVLKLTDEGRSFLETVAPLLDRLGQAAAPANPDAVRGHLRVSADAAFGTYLLMPALPELIRQYPQLRLDIIIRDRIDTLLLEGVDVALRFGEPEFRDLDKSALLQSRVVTCASAEYVRRHGMPSHPNDILEGHNCVRLIDHLTGRPHAWTFVDEAGDRLDIVPNCNIVVNDAPSLLAALRADFGIVRALEFMVDDDIASGRIVEILRGWNRVMWPAYLHTRATAHRSAGLEAFIKFVQSYPFTTAGGG
jgi:DNA-binding transcriptional LysR family regulator